MATPKPAINGNAPHSTPRNNLFENPTYVYRHLPLHLTYENSYNVHSLLHLQSHSFSIFALYSMYIYSQNLLLVLRKKSLWFI